MEIIQLNHSDPRTEVDGERSSVKVPHPFLSDLRVRKALSFLADRETIQRQLYGRLARTTPNLINWAPFSSTNTRWEFSPEKAGRLLDEAGWLRGPDGVRVRNGARLELLFQTSSNPVRQETQAIVKQSCAQAGVAVELKAVAPWVFHSTDPGNPDSFVRFYADLQMYTSVRATRIPSCGSGSTRRGASRRGRTSGPGTTSPAGVTTSTTARGTATDAVANATAFSKGFPQLTGLFRGSSETRWRPG